MIFRSIQRLSKLMIALSWVGIVGFPLFQIWFWLLNPNWFKSIPMRASLYKTDLGLVSNIQLLLAFALSMVGALLLVYALWRVSKMFGEFLQGNFFTQETISHLHAFSICLFLSVIYRLIQTGLISAVLSWHNAPGHRQIVLSFGSGEFSSLFVAGFLLSIAWCFREANRIDLENKEII